MAVRDYLKGTGKQDDPYVIHNVLAWKQFFNIDKEKAGLYFEVVNDIDCGFQLLPGCRYCEGFINGNGHKISGLYCNEWMLFSSAGSASPPTPKLSNIHLELKTGVIQALVHQNDWYQIHWQDVRLDIANSGSSAFAAIESGAKLTNVIINILNSARLLPETAVISGFNSLYVCASDLAQVNLSSALGLIGSDQISPDKYPTLSENLWCRDGVSIPYQIRNGRADLTVVHAIKGVTKIGGIPKKRTIEAHVAAYFGSRWKVLSSSEGEYLINTGDVYDPMIITHYDEYGYPFGQNKSYVIGDVIHPATPNGYAYDCTKSGVSDSTAPQTWPTSGTLTTGDAIFTPRPIYKPESHLVQPVKIDLLTGLPV